MANSSFTTGKYIAPYIIQEKIGEGGFGLVYRALNEVTGQSVAIKEMTVAREFSPEKRKRYQDRFEREAWLSSRLQHPNIVRLLDKGRLGENTLYAVFEYIEGITLKTRLLESGALSALQSAEIMTQVLDALVHAHKLGVIHRDIKPANIMLVNTGAKTHVKILDFGIGALTNEFKHAHYHSLTLTQETLGTPSYSAPEQLRGEPPSPKSDLYVWALVFLECLTGVPAVTGSSLASVFQKQLNPTNIPLPAAIAGHPVSVLLRRLLNKNVNERMGDTLEVYNAFTQVHFSDLVGTITHGTSNSDSSMRRTGVNEAETLHGDASLLRSKVSEKKQITVMCVRLNVRIAPESEHQNAPDMEVVQTLYQDQKLQCVDIVLRFGATHIGSLGDTLLFYFGYPSASENDGRLCARAALELLSQTNKRSSLLQVSQGTTTQVHVGIHTGIVTVHPDTLPDGDTPDIAMALARLAGKNQILCSNTTQNLLASHLEFKEPAVHKLGMKSESVPVFEMIGERMVEALGFLRANQRNHLFVGREKEINALEALNDKNNTDNIAIITGEAGIGKSRLLNEFRRRANFPLEMIAQCLPEHENYALFPVLELIKRQYSLLALSNEDAIERLRGGLSNYGEHDLNSALALLSIWLNIECPYTLPSPANSPDQQKQQLFALLTHLLCSSLNTCNAKAMLFIFEDMHWSDPTTREFLTFFLNSEPFKNTHHIALLTSRELLQSLNLLERCHRIELKNFDNSSMDAFISLLFGDMNVSSNVNYLIKNRTDGIPLFIEELVNMLNSRKLVHHINGQINFVNDTSVEDIPNNLKDSLQQKLDRLSGAKETAQLASSIGREFNYQLLLQSATQDEAKIQADLNELISHDLVFIQRKVHGDSYIFKHALVRDAAYESMLKSRRIECHSLIASAMEARGQQYQQNNAAMLAYHWGEAENFDKAIVYGEKSANAALQRSAANEAIAQGLKIQGWIHSLATEKQTELLLRNYSLLTSAYMENKGWGSAEVLKYSRASLDLLKSSKHYDELVSHLWWQMLNGIVSGRRQTLDKTITEMTALIGRVSPINCAAIKCVEGFYLFTEGDRPNSISSLLDAISYFLEAKDEKHEQTFGFNIQVFAKATLARAYADQCNDTRSRQLAAEAINEAKTLEHIPSIGISLMYSGLVHQQYQNKPEVRKVATDLITLSQKFNLPIYLNFGKMLYDWATNNTSRSQDILSTLKTAGSRHGLGHFQSFYAETHAHLGDFQSALNKIDECISLDSDIKEGNYLAFLWYKKAQYAYQVKGSHSSLFMESFEKSQHYAEEQGVTFILQRLLQDFDQSNISEQRG
ncbi:Serine/threonine-protein kinase PrkC [Thalassocella blandensis]|nr:Serine/threonine-protein kinase PrkC [Thalassocella blandensis]